MEYVAIIAVAVLFLCLLLFLTMLNSLSLKKKEIDQEWRKLDRVFEKRRDTVPYLLETARINAPEWGNLKKWRTELMRNNIPRDERLELEEKMQNAAEALIVTAREHDEIRRDTGFLEAEKDIRKDMVVEIEEAQQSYEQKQQNFNDKLKKFPYIMASGFIRK